MIRENASINLSTIIQANNFSGIVSNVFTKKLSDISKYHTYHDQKYPDLMHESKQIGLEVKASNKPLKGGEGHNGHSGWHIVVCYHILENGDIEFIQVEIADLVGYECHNPDWKYQGSQRNSNNSQRTETYITTNIGTAKLRDGTVYLNPDHVTITPALLKLLRFFQFRYFLLLQIRRYLLRIELSQLCNSSVSHFIKFFISFYANAVEAKMLSSS